MTREVRRGRWCCEHAMCVMMHVMDHKRERARDLERSRLQCRSV
jgi:hypothetical protein